MPIQSKMFEADVLSPLPVPDGTSLQELVNLFLATLDPKNVLDTMVQSFSSAKYGTSKTYTATVIYKE